MKIKLQEYLKRHGYATSNSAAKKLIRDHIVTVNGVQVKSCSIKVGADKNENVVRVMRNFDGGNGSRDGNSSTRTANVNMSAPLSMNTHEEDKKIMNRMQHENENYPRFCVAFNKPCGMICTLATNKDQPETSYRYPTLKDITPPIHEDYRPVGRLDQHSHGLLLFSTDGRLTSALLSPKTGVERTYRIVVRGDVGEYGSDRYDSICNDVANGVDTDYGRVQGRIITMERDVCKERSYEHARCGIGGGNRNDRFDNHRDETQERILEQCSPCDSSMLSYITVVVDEGKKRMVRRLFAAIGLFVLDLERRSYGKIELGNLQSGEWRYLGDEDLDYCREIVQEWETNGASWDK